MQQLQAQGHAENSGESSAKQVQKAEINLTNQAHNFSENCPLLSLYRLVTGICTFSASPKLEHTIYSGKRGGEINMSRPHNKNSYLR